jgi:hypothetical protein
VWSRHSVTHVNAPFGGHGGELRGLESLAMLRWQVVRLFESRDQLNSRVLDGITSAAGSGIAAWSTARACRSAFALGG